MKGSSLSYEDPFSTAVVEAPAEEAQQAPVIGTATLAVKPVVVSDEGKITLTFKGAGGFSDRWLVAHVSTPEDGLALLDNPAFKELLDRSRKIGEYDAKNAPAAPAGAPTPARAPQGATEAPSWAPPKPFEDFVYKTGVSKKNGSTWHAWMPPQQGDSRPAAFFRQN